jgi:hypothetical protein
MIDGFDVRLSTVTNTNRSPRRIRRHSFAHYADSERYRGLVGLIYFRPLPCRRCESDNRRNPPHVARRSNYGFHRVISSVSLSIRRPVVTPILRGTNTQLYGSLQITYLTYCSCSNERRSTCITGNIRINYVIYFAIDTSTRNSIAFIIIVRQRFLAKNQTNQL